MNRNISIVLYCFCILIESSCTPKIHNINEDYSKDICYAYGDSVNKMELRNLNGWSIDSISFSSDLKILDRNLVEFKLSPYARNRKYFVFLSKHNRQKELEFLSSEKPRFEIDIPLFFEKDTISLQDLLLFRFTCGNKAFSVDNCSCSVKSFSFSTDDTTIHINSDKFTTQSLALIANRNIKSFSIDSVLMSTYCKSTQITEKKIETVRKIIDLGSFFDQYRYCIKNEQLNIIPFSPSTLDFSKRELSFSNNNCGVLFFNDLGSYSEVTIYDSQKQNVISKFQVRAGVIDPNNLFFLNGYTRLKLEIRGDFNWEGELILR